MAPLLIVFAKAPTRGAVKMRLTTLLSAELAREIHLAMVKDLLHRLQAVRTEMDVELHTDTATDEWAAAGIGQDLQTPGGLGERLRSAMERALRSGRPAVCILGSDSPTVPLSHLSELLKTNTDVALGPASDGGFYAILCRRVHPRMFDGVTWSAAATCRETTEAARRSGLTVALGPPWYDVDTPGDLQVLLHDPNLGPATRAALEKAGLRREYESDAD
jgi:rSAM/selenodomain-associated transferase 1